MNSVVAGWQIRRLTIEMDEGLTTGTPAEASGVEAGVSPPGPAAGPAPKPETDTAAPTPPRPLDLSELQGLSVEKLDSLARQLDLLHAFQDRRRCGAGFEQHFCIPQNHAQKVVEVVRDSACQSPDRFHLLRQQ